MNLEEHRKWLRSSFLLNETELYKEELKKLISDDIYGKSANFFVSSYNFPSLSFGPAVALENHEPIHKMFGKGYSEIIRSRVSEVGGRKFSTSQKPTNIEQVQFLAMAEKPHYIEMMLSKKPDIKIMLNPMVQPMGPSAPLKKIIEAENITSIPKKVYSLFNEKAKANLGLLELYVRDFDVYYLSKIFSAGVLGEDKKIVPTRWSITAVDDSLGKFNIERIKTFETIDKVMLFESSYLFNDFHVLLIPGGWQFENFEAWAPKTTWGASPEKYFITEEHEGYFGRTRYADSQAGGYYASRFSVTEALKSMNRQATVVVIREVHEGFNIPVGVWQVRENVKNAMNQKPTVFEDVESALTYLKAKLTIDPKQYVSKSKILRQRTLASFQ
ncbi:MAG: hypothetical protein NTY68_02200 [Candidatus Micrarchaeota archaeon]|nr:hypothetical protein [Candidatus Micrarchaeota archaeon]